jgi:hypothetical protein
MDGEWRKLSADELDALIGPVEVEIVAQETAPEDPWANIYDGCFGAEIAAATQVAIPAFSGSRIEAETLIQAAVSLERPPRAWFADPGLTSPTPLTVTDEGRVYGHLALGDTCHTGFRGQCVTVPRGADYSAFLTSRVFCDNGERVAVGPLVADDGHCPPSWPVDKVARYYSDPRLAAAYVTVGEDEWGVWIAGATSAQASAGQVELLRRHPLSGDWRMTGGKMSLYAAVSVNGPGFVVPEVLAASGEITGMITFGPSTVEKSDLILVYEALERLGQLVADGFTAEAGKAQGLVEAADGVVAEYEELLLAAEIGALTIR